MSDEPDEPEVDQPGLSNLREVIANVAAAGGGRSSRAASDAVAGLTVTVSSVPDGMANGLLAGVNPIYGLYANMVAPIVGGALGATALMVINSTSAAALVAGQALPENIDDRADGLFLMVIIAGVIQVAFGALHLGALTRFVSYSVMTGFVAGIATVLVLSQLPTVTGISAEGGNSVTQTIDLFGHLGDVHLPTLGLAALALALTVALRRTPLRTIASLVAIIVPALIVAFAGLDDVELVRDVGSIEGGVPLPQLPSWSNLTGDVLTGALAVSVVVLVQGAGVSQSVTSSAGTGAVSRDFFAQGAANVAAGLFRGLPVGGSLSGTALNVGAGGRGRWAAISSGLWMATIVIALPGLVARVAMPALGALLIVASARSIKPGDITAVWRAGWPSQLAAATTFASTLLLPIQAAVAIGVVLAAFIYVSSSSTDISVVQQTRRDDGSIEERSRPDQLPSRSITVLDVYGNLFYAGARTMERQLPKAAGAEQPVVLLRLRGRASLGATLVDVLGAYAEQIRDAGGRLYLTGLSEAALDHLVRSGRFKPSEGVRAYEATHTLGESTERAYADADAWLVSLNDPTDG